MKTIAMVLCMASAACAVTLAKGVHEQWKTFKAEHQKRYYSELEEKFRMKIFAQNKHKIDKHNKLFARGLVGYSQKTNKYSDLLHHEFLRAMTGFNDTKPEGELRGGSYMPPANWAPPAKIDWRELGAVTEVKDQETCGSCWAFSATGALEGQHFRHTRRLVSLSEQNLIDCSWCYGNRGCRWGRMNGAFQYIKDNGGIDTEGSYPYQALVGPCRYNPNNNGADDVGFTRIPRGRERLLQLAVASEGPLAAAMHGALQSFRHYEKGVYYDERCKAPLRLRHAVLIVGYGTEDSGEEYWLVKNSWGTSWGMSGYGKIARNRQNHCGIASEASYPLV